MLNYITPRFLAKKSVSNGYDDPTKVTEKSWIDTLIHFKRRKSTSFC
ncbi:MAG: hypothetical protein IPO94_06685 [Saprospiraceae bacterium]|nr:hypothetical protein [Saprospiraceae bacterium]